jgi:hypothetical protein
LIVRSGDRPVASGAEYRCRRGADATSIFQTGRRTAMQKGDAQNLE